MHKPLNFEDWSEQYQEQITTELAESGADREMDFDPEKEYLRMYEKYLVKVNGMTEKDFRVYFNMGLTTDHNLRTKLDFRAHQLRTAFILSKVSEILAQAGIYSLTVPSHHHFFKVAREQEINRVYFGEL